MEVILTHDIDKLGYKNDVVKVKKGHARNYLIPRGFALTATPSNLKMHNENLKQASKKLAKIKETAQNLADLLSKKIFKIGAKAGESGKIFGSVTPLQLADVIRLEGFNVDRKKIKLLEEIKQVGTYIANVELHKDVIIQVHFEVVAE